MKIKPKNNVWFVILIAKLVPGETIITVCLAIKIVFLKILNVNQLVGKIILLTMKINVWSAKVIFIYKNTFKIIMYIQL